jgi:hypothetical protein
MQRRIVFAEGIQTKGGWEPLPIDLICCPFKGSNSEPFKRSELLFMA